MTKLSVVMKSVVGFILKGPRQAMLVILLTGLLSPFLPMLGQISGAAMALIALRQPVRQVWQILALSVTGLLVVVGVTVGPFMAGVFAALMLLFTWLPVVVFGYHLRTHVNLGWTLQRMVWTAISMLAVLYLVSAGNPSAWWAQWLQNNVQFSLNAASGQEQTAQQLSAFLQRFLPWVSGILAAAWVLATISNLMIARWLQALAFNPGGFKQEFLSLSLGRPLMLAALLAMVLVMMPGIGLFARDVLLVLLVVLALQGLAWLHWQVGQSRLPFLFLPLVYISSIFLLPYVVIVMAVAGGVEHVRDVRGLRSVDATGSR